MGKYLMTFQNLITRIPKWNPTIIEQERKRIIDRSGCGYLEELVTCVHIIQLKLLTAMRVGQKQKKIDINIPKLDDFIHKAYINVARKIYKNVYLFEISIPPLQIQKNNREMETIVQECILNAVRESIPIEHILKAYMDETVEDDVIEEIKEQVVEKTEALNARGETAFISESDKKEAKEAKGEGIKFNDVDQAVNEKGKEELISAPKTLERLEEISNLRNIQRKMDEEADADDDNEILKISEEMVDLNSLDVHVIGEKSLELEPNFLLDEIEVLA
jgi:hypothetical protein